MWHFNHEALLGRLFDNSGVMRSRCMGLKEHSVVEDEMIQNPGYNPIYYL